MNWKIKYAILGIVFWLLLFLAWEWWQSYPKVRLTPKSHPESREATIDSILVRSLSDFLIPGIAVGIIEDEKITYLKAFGYENLETKDSLTLQSHLPVASVSKIFTALALANYGLAEGFSMDTAVNALMPRGGKLPPEFGQITFRELLEHRSGLKDSRSIKNLLAQEEKRKLSLLPDQLTSPDQQNKAYRYADVNFDLIGYILEASSGRRFGDLVKENTLEAAGMAQSFFSEESLFTSPGHKRTFLWKRIQPENLKFERLPSPSSSLVLTADDLSKALLHLCRGSMGAFDQELNWLKAGTESPAGFQKITLQNIEFFGHFGEQGGFSSILIYAPSLEVGLFLICNSEDKYDFRKSIPSEIIKVIAQ